MGKTSARAMERTPVIPMIVLALILPEIFKKEQVAE
jgi:hypothetical protein